MANGGNGSAVVFNGSAPAPANTPAPATNPEIERLMAELKEARATATDRLLENEALQSALTTARTTVGTVKAVRRSLVGRCIVCEAKHQPRGDMARSSWAECREHWAAVPARRNNPGQFGSEAQWAAWAVSVGQITESEATMFNAPAGA